ncbi:hypothetical protein SDC9_78310 [bioreactor metagenome]|uniref:Uncharacterized protein n=1 Tax=bioreactor metagenome TaxID=1076179 RepID=A0A644YZ54_9ZZZZ
MLNEDDGQVEALADIHHKARHLFQLGCDHARNRLVEQQDLRLGHQRAGNLQPPLFAVRQVLSEKIRFVGKIQLVQKRHDFLVQLAFAALHGRRAEKAARQALLIVHGVRHLNVVRHRSVGEQPDVLEGTGHARLRKLVRLEPRHVAAFVGDRAGGGLVDARQHVEHGGFARAVGADDGNHLSLLERKVEIIHRAETAEHDRKVFYFKNAHEYSPLSPLPVRAGGLIFAVLPWENRLVIQRIALDAHERQFLAAAESVRAVQHNDDQHGRIYGDAPVRKEAQDFRQNRQKRSAYNGTRKRTAAAGVHKHQKVRALGKAEGVRLNERQHVGIQPARNARDERGNAERRDFVLGGVDAHDVRRDFVVTNGNERTPVRRINQVFEQEQRQRHKEQNPRQR